MEQFKLRPMTVHAMRWDGKNPEELHQYFGRIGGKNEPRFGIKVYGGASSDGVFLRPGEWIVVRDGEPIEALSDEAFTAKYEQTA